MFRVIVQVSCLVVLASVFFDVLSCNRFSKTHTYKYINYVGSSKYGKILLKKWKKARRICFKSIGWLSSPTDKGLTTDNRVTVNQVEPPCVQFADWPLDLKKNMISLIHYVIVCFGEKISSFQRPILSYNTLIPAVKLIAAGPYQQIQKSKQTATEFMTKIIPLR